MPVLSTVKERIVSFLGSCLSPVYSGCGCILMFHRILPEDAQSILPANRDLEVTPEMLEWIIEYSLGEGFQPVSLEELPQRIADPRKEKFICFTFDDGYRDNLQYAWPLFQKHEVPFSIAVTTSYIEGENVAWWYFLDTVLGERAELTTSLGGEMREWKLTSIGEKEAAFLEIATFLRGLEARGRDDWIAEFRDLLGWDGESGDARLFLTWDELEELKKEPLVTFAAHSVNHLNFSNVSEDTVRAEIVDSCRILEEKLGRPVSHFVYPFGGANAVGEREVRIAREAGLATAMTTRPGMIFAAHRDHLHCLPRMNVSGCWGSRRNIRETLTGMAAARRNRFRRVVTL